MPIVWGIAACILISTAANGFGKRIIGKALPFAGRIETTVIETTLGYGVISAFTFLAAALHLLHFLFFLVVLTAGNLLFIQGFRYFQPPKPRTRLKISLPLLFLIVLIVVNLFFALFPPTFHDAMVYHLAVPSLYIMEGGFVPWNTNYNSNLPLQVEMLFLFALLGKAVHTTNLLSLVSSLLIILLLSSWFGRSRGGNGQYSALLFFSIPQVGFLTTISNTDISGMLYMLVAIRLFFFHLDALTAASRSVIESNRLPLILSGIFWGFALASKYSFIFFFAGFILAVFFFLRAPFAEKWRKVLVIALVAFLILLPWLIKNLVFTGNPVYPYLSNLFPSDSWNPAQAAQFATGFLRGETSNPGQLLAFPFNMFLFPYRYGLTSVLGILFLVFFPFIFFSVKTVQFRFLTLFSTLAFGFLLFFARIPRFFLPSLLLFAIPIADGMLTIMERIPRMKRLILILFYSLLSLNLVQQVSLQERFTLGIHYLKTRMLKSPMTISAPYLYALPCYPAIDFINRNLNDQIKVMFLGEDRSFYMKKQFIVCSQADQHPLIEISKKSVSAEAIATEVEKLSVSHILLSNSGLHRFMTGRPQVYSLTADQQKRINQFLQQWPIIYSDKTYQILENPKKQIDKK